MPHKSSLFPPSCCRTNRTRILEKGRARVGNAKSCIDSRDSGLRSLHLSDSDNRFVTSLVILCRQMKEPWVGSRIHGALSIILTLQRSGKCCLWNTLKYCIFRSAHIGSIFSPSAFILGKVLLCNREMWSPRVISSTPFSLWLFLCFSQTVSCVFISVSVRFKPGRQNPV